MILGEAKLLLTPSFPGCKLVSLIVKTSSESYYFIGVYYWLTRNVTEAIRYLDLCIAQKELNQEYDKCYANALYNLGAIYGRLGDFKKT